MKIFMLLLALPLAAKDVTVTAYCACQRCCGPKAAGITASGRRPVEGITIAASRSIPLGTWVQLTVPGAFTKRPFRVDDRLADQYDHRVDVYFLDHKTALKFGINKGTYEIVLQNRQRPARKNDRRNIQGKPNRVPTRHTKTIHFGGL